MQRGEGMPLAGREHRNPLAGVEAPGTWEYRVALPSAQAHLFTYTLRVTATPRRELDPLIFFH